MAILFEFAICFLSYKIVSYKQISKNQHLHFCIQFNIMDDMPNPFDEQFQPPQYHPSSQTLFYQLPFSIPINPHPHPNSPIISLHLSTELTFILQPSYRCIQHIDSMGTILRQYRFDNLIFHVMMASSNIIVVFLKLATQERICQIIQICLDTCDMFIFQFFYQYACVSQVDAFRKCSMFCITQRQMQKGKVSDIRVNYFKYPLHLHYEEKQVKPIYQTNFHVTDFYQELGPNFSVLRLNQEGTIAVVSKAQNWFPYFDIFVYDVRNSQIGKKQKWKNYQFDLDKAGVKFNRHQQALSIVNVWEIQNGVLFLRFFWHSLGIRFDKMVKTLEQMRSYQKMYNFTWNYKSKGPKQIYKKFYSIPPIDSMIVFTGQSNKISYTKNCLYYILQVRQVNRKQPITTFKSEDELVFHEWCSKQLRQEMVNVYYVNGSDGTVVGCEEKSFHVLERNKEAEASHVKMVPVSYDCLKFVEYYQTFGQQQKQQNILHVKLKILKQLKDKMTTIAAYFLTQILHKCDQNLMMQICQILQSIQNDPTYHF